MAPKGLGRPKNQIHTLYKKVTGQGHAANNPHFECIGCDADVLGKELSKLCAHSTHCTYLTDEQRELAGTCFEELAKKTAVSKLQEEEAASDSSGSGTSTRSSKRKKSNLGGPLDSHVDRVRLS
jgi:hypothetical protein